MSSKLDTTRVEFVHEADDLTTGASHGFDKAFLAKEVYDPLPIARVTSFNLAHLTGWDAVVTEAGCSAGWIDLSFPSFYDVHRHVSVDAGDVERMTAWKMVASTAEQLAPITVAVFQGTVRRRSGAGRHRVSPN
jgi:hypothetical protein